MIDFESGENGCWFSFKINCFFEFHVKIKKNSQGVFCDALRVFLFTLWILKMNEIMI